MWLARRPAKPTLVTEKWAYHYLFSSFLRHIYNLNDRTRLCCNKWISDGTSKLSHDATVTMLHTAKYNAAKFTGLTEMKRSKSNFNNEGDIMRNDDSEFKNLFLRVRISKPEREHLKALATQSSVSLNN
ncbi:MAG: hypothetical protein K0R73_1132 [Candidatus Midichloriaceae bacterium]|nr:hypothetical protein [Candidatus Midichloriaceae bacterium]